MSLVSAYETKIKDIVSSRLGGEEILQVFWEPDSGRVVFGYKETRISKSGRKSKKWKCFKIQVIDDDMADALKEQGISRDMWETYLGTMVDNMALNFEELLCHIVVRASDTAVSSHRDSAKEHLVIAVVNDLVGARALYLLKLEVVV